jgi:hypothetical protein
LAENSGVARSSWLVKAVVGLAALAVVAVLFVRSVRSTRAAPFDVERARLTGWTLVVEPPQDPFDSFLALRPPPQLGSSLGNEIFARGGETVSYPNPPLVPLLLRSEFDRAFAGTPPEEIIRLAQGIAWDSTAWTPRCMGYRRLSEPRGPRAVYFVLLEAAPFDRFRQQLAERVRSVGREASAFEPQALSPVLIVAALDADFGRWMPLRADPDADCYAPVSLN